MRAGPDLSLPRFEGPLDLLLELIRKNQIDISDIPIAEITRQYLDYLHQAEELDLALGADFAYMAALLIHIKSRCLLKTDPEVAAREEDPRHELVRLLLSHDQVREGAEFLKQKLEVAQATWSRSAAREFWECPGEEPAASSTPFNALQILRLAQQALETARLFDVVIPAASVTVEQMAQWLEQKLAGVRGRIEAQPLLTEQPSPEHRAALFLAMLEMASAAQIRLEQHQCFGPILVERIPNAQGPKLL